MEKQVYVLDIGVRGADMLNPMPAAFVRKDLQIGMTPMKLPQVPQLAQGAVLPANKPFLAVVGDQKQGTNVEAPLETIRQAVAEVMQNQTGSDVVINFTGDLAQLARVLKPQIDRENRRVGVKLVTGAL